MARGQVPGRTLGGGATIDRLQQWRNGLVQLAGIPSGVVGVVGGGEHTARPITVMTYDSAALPRRPLEQFGLLVVDEAHHLPAPTYRTIAERVRAPWRLGLSATPERRDGAHE